MSLKLPEGYRLYDEVKAEVQSTYSDEEWAGYDAAVEQADTEIALAELVYTMRTTAGMTQRELADKTGSTQPFISDIERGTRTPTIPTLMRLAKATGNDLRIDFTPSNP